MLKNKAKEKSLNLYHHEKCPLKKFLLIIFRSFSFFQIEQKSTYCLLTYLCTLQKIIGLCLMKYPSETIQMRKPKKIEVFFDIFHFEHFRVY